MLNFYHKLDSVTL